jgi:hypothetical protein
MHQRVFVFVVFSDCILKFVSKHRGTPAGGVALYKWEGMAPLHVYCIASLVTREFFYLMAGN